MSDILLSSELDYAVRQLYTYVLTRTDEPPASGTRWGSLSVRRHQFDDSGYAGTVHIAELQGSGEADKPGHGELSPEVRGATTHSWTGDAAEALAAITDFQANYPAPDPEIRGGYRVMDAELRAQLALADRALAAVIDFEGLGAGAGASEVTAGIPYQTGAAQ